jgi:hypothetical protein
MGLRIFIFGVLMLSACGAQTNVLTKRIQTQFGAFALNVDTLTWRQDKIDEAGKMELDTISGDGYARIITERVPIRTDALRDFAISNMKGRLDAGTFKVVLEEERNISSRRVMALQFEGNFKAVPFRFYGYVYGGTSGSIQVWTYTTQKAFPNVLGKFTRLLNGLEISDNELPPLTGGMLPLAMAKMKLKYNPAKWKQKPIEEEGRVTFRHTSSDAYGVVISEHIPIPMESLPDFVLANAQSVDPNAKIVLQEKHTVNGLDVWFVKIRAEASGVTFIYYDCLYSNDLGTVQLVLYTSEALFKEFERDFVAFFNGLSNE